MDAQAAVESARFYSYSYPDSFAPHAYYPGLLKLEAPFPESTANLLRQKGHTVERWPVDEWPRTGVCIAIDDRRQGIKLGAADSRRTSYAVGR